MIVVYSSSDHCLSLTLMLPTSTLLSEAFCWTAAAAESPGNRSPDPSAHGSPRPSCHSMSCSRGTSSTTHSHESPLHPAQQDIWQALTVLGITSPVLPLFRHSRRNLHSVQNHTTPQSYSWERHPAGLQQCGREVVSPSSPITTSSLCSTWCLIRPQEERRLRSDCCL